MKQPTISLKQNMAGAVFFSLHSTPGLTFLLCALLLLMLLVTIYLYRETQHLKQLSKSGGKKYERSHLDDYLSALSGDKLLTLLRARRRNSPPDSTGSDAPTASTNSSPGSNSAGAPNNPAQRAARPLLLTLVVLCSSVLTFAQDQKGVPNAMLAEPGFLIIIILLLIPIFAAIVLMAVKVTRMVNNFQRKRIKREETAFENYLNSLSSLDAEAALARREHALNYQLPPNELSGNFPAQDNTGLLHNIDSEAALPIVSAKKRASSRPPVDPRLARLVAAYIVCAAGWLVVGTSIGEYLGIKFVAPDADHLKWLSFGRLRPVHTNIVFWGWSSLGMLSLGYYIVPRVGNNSLYSIKKGWYSLIFINAAVLIGSVSLMAGINNGGGEYREYLWPIMFFFALGVAITLQNFLRTIARRTTKEIYISNWYIVSALIFVLVITVIAYIPWWQDGLGETIVQGYWMHQGVGMWFMFFTLGIVYYFLPQQLNKPIYSYSLGILAFWSQILFYTLVGTHHFLFSSIPWWLQTVAIVASVGMVIPVTAGATNFLLTIRGSWHSVASSYTLPFFITGVIFYFTGSMQGTAEAFRSASLVWHFTDFTVAHSHITMYGIIAFFLWAAMYAVIPRLTGKEAPQATIGAHFWLALIGVLFYTIPLMYGSTLKGLLWSQGKPFIDGLVLMAPYWLWRSIGGTLMWLSHLVFVYNIYRMMAGTGVLSRRLPAVSAAGTLSGPSATVSESAGTPALHI